MKLLVACDAHIYYSERYGYWTPAIYGFSFWERYLHVFDSVRIVARVKYIDDIDTNVLSRVDGDSRIEVWPIPFFQGPKQFLKNFHSINKALRHVSRGCGAALLRIPGITGQVTDLHIKKSLPLALEIVADPYGQTNDEKSKLSLRLITSLVRENCRFLCYKANGVSYVTKNAIQKKCSCRALKKGETEKYFTASYSSITLKEDDYAPSKDFTNKKAFTFVLSNVSMNSYFKGEKVVIQIIKGLADKGYNVRGVFIGDGTKRREFEAYAQKLGVGQIITFTGRLSHKEDVKKILMSSDIFILPSQTEGLPRSILGAMAVGLPCISTPVGGIPEIIDKEFLREPRDVSGFMQVAENLMKDPEKMNLLSIRNRQIADAFNNHILQKRRDEFYSKLRKLTK